MTRLSDDDTSFRVLRALEHNPELSQRQLAQTARVSLGAINYCLKALQKRGLITVGNFRASSNKLGYAYMLTPNGLAAKAALTKRFLERKLAEYAALEQEIEAVRRDLDRSGPE